MSEGLKSTDGWSWFIRSTLRFYERLNKNNQMKTVENNANKHMNMMRVDIYKLFSCLKRILRIPFSLYYWPDFLFCFAEYVVRQVLFSLLLILLNYYINHFKKWTWFYNTCNCIWWNITSNLQQKCTYMCENVDDRQ